MDLVIVFDPAPGPAAPGFTDTFTRANEALEASANWDQLSWSSTETSADIVSNLCEFTRPGVSGLLGYQYTGVLANDQYAEFTYDSHAQVSGGNLVGCCVRQAASTQDMYFAFYDAAAGTPNLKLEKQVSGSGTLLGSTYNVTLVQGNKVKLKASATSISVELDTGGGFSTVIGPVTDSAHSSGKAGIRGFLGATGNLQRWSQFRAGDL